MHEPGPQFLHYFGLAMAFPQEDKVSGTEDAEGYGEDKVKEQVHDEDPFLLSNSRCIAQARQSTITVPSSRRGASGGDAG